MLVALVLSFDVVLAFRNADKEWGHMGLGTLLMLINVVYIWLYTLSCHSCRHVRRRPAAPLQQAPGPLPAVDLASRSSTSSHARYAWVSLFSVALVDLYIYLLATGRIEDVRFF